MPKGQQGELFFEYFSQDYHNIEIIKLHIYLASTIR